MAIALGNVLAWGLWSGGSSSQTRSFTVGAGTGRILIAFVHNTGLNYAASGVTYNGVAMTPLWDNSFASNESMSCFYMVNPPVGTANIVWSRAGTNASGETAAVSFNGVDQATPFGSPVSNTSAGTSSSINVGASGGQIVIDQLACRFGTGSPNPQYGGLQTGFTFTANGNNGDGVSMQSGVGTLTMSWTWTNSRSFYHTGLPMNPLVSGDVLRTLGMEGGMESGMKMAGMQGGIRG